MAVFPVVPGSPDYSSTSSNAYIPAIYSSLLIKKFYPETIFKKISNTNYEGEISSQGDTVNIRTRATIETGRYRKGMVLPIQNPESPLVTLKVDQGEFYSVAMDKVDERQSDINLIQTWGEDAAKQMAQVIDRNVLTSVAAAGAVAITGTAGDAANISGYSASTANTNILLSKGSAGNPGAIVSGGFTAKGTSISTTMGTSAAASEMSTGDLITARLLKLSRYLRENNAGNEGLFVVVPEWVREKLLSIASGNNFGLAYATGQNSAGVISGAVPKIAGFEILFSNNVPLTTQDATKDTSPIIFGSSYATTFATQITESRIIDNPYAWGKLMQGLQVYGFGIIKPQLIGVDFWKSVA